MAKKDIKEAADWYNSKQPGLGKRFTHQLRAMLNIVKQHPYIIAVRYDNVRTCVLDVFPYMVHYVIDDPNKSIVISAVLHTSRNPDLWKTDRDEDNPLI